jgi:hypothetical protein
VSVLHIRGFALPDGEPADLYADGDRWTDDPVAGAELAGQGWLLPGLVDAHTHPGAANLGDPLDDDVLRADLRQHAAAGVTLIRSPGLAGDPPDWFGQARNFPARSTPDRGWPRPDSSSKAGAAGPATISCRPSRPGRPPGPAGPS